MLVKDLIQSLLTLDPDMPIVVRGFDQGGYDMVQIEGVISIRERKNPFTHWGKYDDESSCEPDDDSYKPPFKALLLDGN